MNDLIANLHSAARSISAASKMLADAKTKRNVAAGETDCCYEYLQPEQTTEWKAANEIERLQEQIRRIKVYVLPPDSYFETPDNTRNKIYDRLVEILYPGGAIIASRSFPSRSGGWDERAEISLAMRDAARPREAGKL